MSNSTAKDLLEQADRLIRRPKASEDVPVLTDMVGGQTISPRNKVSIPDLTERVDTGDVMPKRADLPEVEELSMSDFRRAVDGTRREPTLGASAASAKRGDAPRGVKQSAEAATYTREQFDAAVSSKLEQLQHSVYSQVMQQLELHATGEMKRRLREALEPALTQVALDIAAQVADETAIQVQSIVSNAVENEVARLREQIQTKRRERDSL
jgi:hypothetical protein